MKELIQKLDNSIKNKAFDKTVLSGGFQDGVKKIVYTTRTKKDIPYVFEEKFTLDGKAYHAYIEIDGAAERIISESEQFKQTDISCGDFSAVILRSKKGAVHIKYLKGKENTEKASDDKNYILSQNQKYDFLEFLQIQDKNG